MGTNEMVIGKSNTYQRTFLIVASSLLAMLVLIVITGTSGGQHLTSSAAKIAEVGADALAEYQGDSTNYALTKDMFGMGAVAENEKNCCIGKFCWECPNSF